MFLVFATFALFSSTFPVSKVILESGGLLFFLGGRMFLAGILLLGALAFFRPASIKLSKAIVPQILLVGMLTFFFTNIFEFKGLAHLPSWKTCFIYNFSPFVSALLSWAILKEQLNLRKWMGLFIGFMGVSLIFIREAWENQSQWWNFGLPECFVIAAVLTSCLAWVLLRQLGTRESMDPVGVNAYGMFLAGGLCLIGSLLFESWTPVPATDLSFGLTGSAYVLIVNNLLAYNLYGALLKRFSATLLALAGGMTSFFAAAWGILFLNESVSVMMLPASLIALTGLWLFYREELRQDIILRKARKAAVVAQRTDLN